MTDGKINEISLPKGDEIFPAGDTPEFDKLIKTLNSIEAAVKKCNNVTITFSPATFKCSYALLCSRLSAMFTNDDKTINEIKIKGTKSVYFKKSNYRDSFINSESAHALSPQSKIIHIKSDNKTSKVIDAILKVCPDSAWDNKKDTKIGVRHVLSELISNVFDHADSVSGAWIQGRYQKRNAQFEAVICDTGIGIYNHLKKKFSSIASSSEALKKAVGPNFSGAISKSYQKNNAGMGLFISSQWLKEMKGDFYLISDDARLHVSGAGEPTLRKMSSSWQGTIVYVGFRLLADIPNSADIMRKILAKAKVQGMQTDSDRVGFKNAKSIYLRDGYGKNLENKEIAKNIRDEIILPALKDDKNIIIDFDGIESTIHSFVTAMLATPCQKYKNIRNRIIIKNASQEIRDIIDFVIDTNISP